MKAWLPLSLCCGLWLVTACGDDDGANDDKTSGAGRGGGPIAEAGASNDSGGAGDGLGGANGEGNGEGGAPQCEAPEPPSAGAGGASELELTGSYTDSFGGEHDVTTARWQTGSSTYHIVDFDNEDGWVIARNAQTNRYSPCLWSRFDWTRNDDKLYFCQTAFDAMTEAEARATPAADPSDPAVTGCGSFAWSELIVE